MTPYTLNIRGTLHTYSEPAVMAILNITTDSFYSQSRIPASAAEISRRAEALIEQGASFIDIGAYSTRPGAGDIPVDEETRRIVMAAEAVRRVSGDIPVSVDTFRASVARAAVEAGADIINDISGGLFDSEMLPTVASLRVPYILMHLRGSSPAEMHSPQTYAHPAAEILAETARRIDAARSAGIADIIADPGFGFSKNLDQNYNLLAHLGQFRTLECPLLVGISRKSMATRLLGITADEALNATTVLNTLALERGAAILRVHDPAPALEAIKIHLALLNNLS